MEGMGWGAVLGGGTEGWGAILLWDGVGVPMGGKGSLRRWGEVSEGWG